MCLEKKTCANEDLKSSWWCSNRTTVDHTKAGKLHQALIQIRSALRLELDKETRIRFSSVSQTIRSVSLFGPLMHNLPWLLKIFWEILLPRLLQTSRINTPTQ
jgi:hypothetical protein